MGLVLLLMAVMGLLWCYVNRPFLCDFIRIWHFVSYLSDSCVSCTIHLSMLVGFKIFLLYFLHKLCIGIPSTLQAISLLGFHKTVKHSLLNSYNSSMWKNIYLGIFSSLFIIYLNLYCDIRIYLNNTVMLIYFDLLLYYKKIHNSCIIT